MSDGAVPNSDERIDEEMAATMILAAEIIARLKTINKTELELPMIDEDAVWVVTVKRLGINANGHERRI
jgi:hypothetical protein